MSGLSTMFVNGTLPADPLVYAGDGPTLIGNADVTNTLWLGESNAIIAGKPDDTIQLTPQSWVVVDGKESIFGITSGPTIQVTLIPGGLAFFQSGISGGGFIANNYGAFFYSGTAGPGTLIVSITSSTAPGIDQYGNTYTPGCICIGTATNNVQVLLKTLAGQLGAVVFPTNVAIESVTGQANITSGVGGSGPGQFVQLAISGPNINVAAAHDWVQLLFNSANQGNTSNANLDFNYIGSNQAQHEYAYLDATGFNILAGTINARHPGSSPAVAEGWQTVAVGGSPAWSGGPVNYRLLPTNEVQVYASLTSPASTPVNNNTFATLPVGYRPVTAKPFPIRATGGTDAIVTLRPDGTLQSNAVTLTGTGVTIGPINLPLN